MILSTFVYQFHSHDLALLLQAPAGGEAIGTLWAWLQITCFVKVSQHSQDSGSPQSFPQLKQAGHLDETSLQRASESTLKDEAPTDAQQSDKGLSTKEVSAEPDQSAEQENTTTETGNASAGTGSANRDKSAPLTSAPNQQVSDLLDVMQLWPAFSVLIEAGRGKIAVSLLQQVVWQLIKSQHIRSTSELCITQRACHAYQDRVTAVRQ